MKPGAYIVATLVWVILLVYFAGFWYLIFKTAWGLFRWIFGGG
jgi:hypothetical protein